MTRSTIVTPLIIVIVYVLFMIPLAQGQELGFQRSIEDDSCLSDLICTGLVWDDDTYFIHRCNKRTVPDWNVTFYKLDSEGNEKCRKPLLHRGDSMYYYPWRLIPLESAGQRRLLLVGSELQIVDNQLLYYGFLWLMDTSGLVLNYYFDDQQINFPDYKRMSYIDAIIQGDSIIVCGIQKDSASFQVALKVFNHELKIKSSYIYPNSMSQGNAMIIPLNNGGYVIFGDIISHLRIDNFVMRIGSDMKQQWYRRIYGNGKSAMPLPGVVELPDGSLMLTTGMSFGNQAWPTKYVQVLHGDTGAKIWDKQYVRDNMGSVFTVKSVLVDNRYIDVAGDREIYFEEENWRRRFPTLSRLDLAGNVLWERLYYTREDKPHTLYGATVDATAGHLLYGQYNAQLPEKTHIGYIIRTDAEACVVPGCDSLGMVSRTMEDAGSPAALQVYPNPARDHAQIDYILSSHPVQPLVYLVDMQGRIVDRVPLPHYTRQGQVIWDTSHLRTGLYFVVLEDTGRILSRTKLVIGE
jgi:hypothetical protein